MVCGSRRCSAGTVGNQEVKRSSRENDGAGKEGESWDEGWRAVWWVHVPWGTGFNPVVHLIRDLKLGPLVLCIHLEIYFYIRAQ